MCFSYIRSLWLKKKLKKKKKKKKKEVKWSESSGGDDCLSSLIHLSSCLGFTWQTFYCDHPPILSLRSWSIGAIRAKFSMIIICIITHIEYIYENIQLLNPGVFHMFLFNP